MLSHLLVTIIPMITFQPVQVPWNVSPEVVSTCRTIGFFLGLIWLVWLLAQFALPKNRNNMMVGGGGGKVAQFIGAAVVIVILMDINMIPTIINWIIAAVVGIWNLLFGS